MGRIRKKWSDKKVVGPLDEIHAGMSIGQLSRETGIPKSTLYAKMKGTRPI